MKNEENLNLIYGQVKNLNNEVPLAKVLTELCNIN